jgi:hypothetical protein
MEYLYPAHGLFFLLFFFEDKKRPPGVPGYRGGGRGKAVLFTRTRGVGEGFTSSIYPLNPTHPCIPPPEKPHKNTLSA